MNKKIEKKYYLYAFVGPIGTINRMFETEQGDDVKPQSVTQIRLTEEQHDQVWALRKEGKRAAIENGQIIEFLNQ
jgi:Spy/CpxP family protein refolding chaperone